MSKRFKKVIAVVCAIAMVVTSMTVYNSKSVKAVDWSNTSEWTAVNVGGVEYKMTAETGWVRGFATHGAATGYMNGDALWCNFADAAYTKVVVNGVTYESASYQDASDTVRFMGAQMWWMPSLCSAQQNTITFYQNDTVKDTVYVYNPNGVEGETTTADPDATTAESEETTTELQVPTKPVGLVANINDLKTNYTIAFAPITTATSFNLYIDGELYGQITNGGILAIAEAGLVAGQTYSFQVSAVNAAGESELSDVVSVTIPSVEETTTAVTEETTTVVTEETTTEGEAFDPSTITDWTPVLNSTTLSYYIADGKDDKVSVKPQQQADGIYIAYSLAAVFKSVTFNGEVKEPTAGAFYTIPFEDVAAEGYYTLTVEDYYGNESVTIYFKKTAEAETTTAEPTTAAPFVDGGELLKDTAFVEGSVSNWNEYGAEYTNNGDGSVSVVVPAKESGDNWSTQLVQNNVTLTEGKWYVATVTVTSDVARSFQLLIQSDGANGGNWSVINTDNVFTVEAGVPYTFTTKFQATGVVNNYLYGVMMGYVNEASAEANVTVSKVSLKGYDNEPVEETTTEEATQPAVTKYNVTVDGKAATEVEEGQTYTLPTEAVYGYFDGTNMYKAGATVTVNSDMAFTSVNDLSVTVAQGAGIKLDGANTSGIRFQATVASSNMDAVASDAITEGMLITANDIFENNDSVMDLTSTYTLKNIPNSGWYNGVTGTYCGSIVNIVESNYIRNFIARAYVTVNYVDGETVTVYSGMSSVRSIQYVAAAIKDAGYPGIDEAYKSIIDTFAAAN